MLVHLDDLAGRFDSTTHTFAICRSPAITADRPGSGIGVADEDGVVARMLRQARAPGTTSSGPWSPPIASTATRTDGRSLARTALKDSASVHLVRRPSRPSSSSARSPGGRCSSRSSGRRGAALRLVAVRALLELRQLDREVAAALALARVRHPSLRDSHGSVWLLSGPAQAHRARPRTSSSCRGPIAGSRSAGASGADARVYALSSPASTRNARSASSRGSIGSSSCRCGPLESSSPQMEQRPGQSGRHTGAMGAASRIASRTNGSDRPVSLRQVRASGSSERVEAEDPLARSVLGASLVVGTRAISTSIAGDSDCTSRRASTGHRRRRAARGWFGRAESARPPGE